MKYTDIDLETTINELEFVNQLEDKAKALVERGPVLFRECEPYELNDKYSVVYELYAANKMINIHEFLRCDDYSVGQKREVLKPLIVGWYGGTFEEEMDMFINMSKKVDLVEELLLDDKYQSESEKQSREYYFAILREGARLLLDDVLSKVKDESGYRSVQEDTRKLRIENSEGQGSCTFLPLDASPSINCESENYNGDK
jgi:hypothetical protein